ncbi:MAG TPA: fluoride efflux transporter CrcB [Candidatus Acidoferrum sp.]|nr:fluoride efflux transporter CrcB [Candidatus Acidoferrum sp.]
MKTLWIGLGGALGSVARYQVDGWLQKRLGTGFPYGTLAVNVVGSFLLVLLMVVALRTELVPPVVRVALATGVLGGFTTYSTFNYETLRYVQNGAWAMGAMNAAITVFGCLAAGLLGWALGRVLVGA